MKAFSPAPNLILGVNSSNIQKQNNAQSQKYSQVVLQLFPQIQCSPPTRPPVLETPLIIPYPDSCFLLLQHQVSALSQVRLLTVFYFSLALVMRQTPLPGLPIHKCLQRESAVTYFQWHCEWKLQCIFLLQSICHTYPLYPAIVCIDDCSYLIDTRNTPIA